MEKIFDKKLPKWIVQTLYIVNIFTGIIFIGKMLFYTLNKLVLITEGVTGIASLTGILIADFLIIGLIYVNITVLKYYIKHRYK